MHCMRSVPFYQSINTLAAFAVYSSDQSDRFLNVRSMFFELSVNPAHDFFSKFRCFSSLNRIFAANYLAFL